MATLADLANMLAAMQQDPGTQGATTDRGAYLDYQQACAEAGKTALPYDQWVKAGKPKI